MLFIKLNISEYYYLKFYSLLILDKLINGEIVTQFRLEIYDSLAPLVHIIVRFHYLVIIVSIYPILIEYTLYINKIHIRY